MTTILVNDILKQILDADPCAHTICALLRVSKGVASQIRAIYAYNISAHDFALIDGRHYQQIVVRISDSFRKKGPKLLTQQMKMFLVHRAIKTRAFEMFRDFVRLCQIKMKFNEFRDIICDPWLSHGVKLKFALYCQKNRDTVVSNTDANKIFIDNSALILSGHEAYLKKGKADTYEIYVANGIESMYKYDGSNRIIAELNIEYGISGENYHYNNGVIPKVSNKEYFGKHYCRTIESDDIHHDEVEECVMRAVNYYDDESLKGILEAKQQSGNFDTFISLVEFLYSAGYNRSARVLMRPHLIRLDESKYENQLLLTSFIKWYNLRAIEDYYDILEMDCCNKYRAMVKLLTH